jgi:hypothetical protein
MPRQEKAVKPTSLLANCVTFHTTPDLMNVVRDLQAEGWQITGRTWPRSART